MKNNLNHHSNFPLESNLNPPRNPFGITEISFKELVSVLSSNPDVLKVLVFGSRAMGNYKNSSDIDLAIVFKSNIDFITFLDLKARLQNSNIIPYTVDVIDYSTISNPNLKDHVDTVGKPLY